jgi:hypothetical protein
MKLLTTRPSSIFIRGPYVLKILAMRISINIKETMSAKLLPRNGESLHIYLSHVAYDSQTSMSQPHASPHHSSSEPLLHKRG